VVSYVRDSLRDILIEKDENSDKQISKNEFLKILERRDACMVLKEIAVDPVAMIENVDFIFEQDLKDGTEDTKSFDEFMLKILQLRGTNTSTVKEIVELRRFVKKSFEKPSLLGPPSNASAKPTLVGEDPLQMKSASAMATLDGEDPLQIKGWESVPSRSLTSATTPGARPSMPKDLDALEHMARKLLKGVQCLKAKTAIDSDDLPLALPIDL